MMGWLFFESFFILWLFLVLLVVLGFLLFYNSNQRGFVDQRQYGDPGVPCVK